MKNILKNLPNYLIIGAIVLLSLYSAYKILIVQREIYNNYNNQTGIVTWAQYSDRSATYFCGVILPDGSYDEVNAGSRPRKTGDTYINRMQYNYFFGLSGLAYSVEPENTPNVIWNILYVFIFLIPIAYMIKLIFVGFLDWWKNKFKDK